ncbi:unnamed protein product, partial [Hymenolepis diminuta]
KSQSGNQAVQPPPTTVDCLLLANPNSVLPRHFPLVPPNNARPMLVLRPPLMILYSLPILFISFHSKHSYICYTTFLPVPIRTLSHFRCGRSVTSPSRLTDYVQ